MALETLVNFALQASQTFISQSIPRFANKATFSTAFFASSLALDTNIFVVEIIPSDTTYTSFFVFTALTRGIAFFTFTLLRIWLIDIISLFTRYAYVLNSLKALYAVLRTWKAVYVASIKSIASLASHATCNVFFYDLTALTMQRTFYTHLFLFIHRITDLTVITCIGVITMQAILTTFYTFLFF